MKSTIQLLALSLAFALPLMAGQAVPNTSQAPYTGRIVYLSDTKLSVKATGAKASTAFKLAADTKMTLNGEAKTAAELKKGWKAIVTPKADDPGTAASVAVNTSAPAEVEKKAE